MTQQGPFRRKVFLLSPEFPSFGICGSRGSGKSVLLEFIEEWYYRHDYVVLDWFGSIDHENAYWCVPETVPIGRWDKLETEDSSKLIEYLKKRFCSKKEETGFIVERLDENGHVVNYSDPIYGQATLYGILASAVGVIMLLLHRASKKASIENQT